MDLLLSVGPLLLQPTNEIVSTRKANAKMLFHPSSSLYLLSILATKFPAL